MLQCISPFSVLAVSSAQSEVPMYEFRYVKGHVEVFLDGVFQFSADTMKEAEDELRGA